MLTAWQGGSVPKEYIPGVAKGLESIMGCGVLAGFPVIGCKATLVDGGYHDVDSSVMAFEIAGRACARKGLREAGAKLMEPMMKVEVSTHPRRPPSPRATHPRHSPSPLTLATHPRHSPSPR